MTIGVAVVAVAAFAGCDKTVKVTPGTGTDAVAAAVEKVRAMRAAGETAPVTLELADGTYYFSRPLKLDARDHDLTIRAKNRTKAVLSGSERLVWKPLSDANAKRMIPKASQAHVLEADIAGTDPLPGFAGGGGAHARRDLSEQRLALYQGETRLTCARWPKEGEFALTGETWGKKQHPIGGAPVPHDGYFKYHDKAKLRAWAKESDLWMFGYWHFEWAEVTSKVDEIRPEEETVKVDARQDTYGYVKDAKFYVFNAFGELDEPGEWVIDRKNRKFFVWPLAGEQTPSVGRCDSLVVASNCCNVVFDGLTVEATRCDAMTFRDSTNVTVKSSVIRHTGQHAVIVTGGANALVTGCDMYDLGEGGVSLEGGDHDTLTPANHVADNNHIHHYGVIVPSSRPGVAVHGVGNRCTHNLIHHANHQAVRFNGNDHYVGYNVIHDVCRFTWDAGAIYGYDLDWSKLGTVIEYNVIFMVGKQPRGTGVSGVYLDAYTSGNTVRGNIMNRIIDGVWHNGGQHNVYEKNIFMNCNKSAIMRYDLGPAGPGMKHVWSKGKDSLLYKPFLRKLDLYKSDLWQRKYPWMLEVLDIEDVEFAHSSLFNTLRDNVAIASGAFHIFHEKETGKYTVSTNNVHLKGDPDLFVDYFGLDWRVKPGSELAKLIPDDRFEKMGLYDSPLRVTPARKFAADVSKPRPLVGEYGWSRVKIWWQMAGDKPTTFECGDLSPLEWSEKSFTWTPDKDGLATLTLGGTYGERTAYDDFKVTGAKVMSPGFENEKDWKVVNAMSGDPYIANNRNPPWGVVGVLPGDPKGFGPVQGSKMALCNAERRLVQEKIAVRKGVPVTVTFKARAYFANY